MTATIIILSILLAINVVANVVLLERFVRLGRVVLDVEEAVEESLDGIDQVYGRVGQILQTSLASNDPKVVQIHNELRRSRDYLLVVANRLIASWDQREEQKDPAGGQE